MITTNSSLFFENSTMTLWIKPLTPALALAAEEVQEKQSLAALMPVKKGGTKVP